MNIALHLQKLDDLILAHTRPPATAILRNHLHPLLDQMEASALASETQLRIKTRRIKSLEKENAQLVHDYQQEISNLFLLEYHKQHRDT